MAWTTPRTWNAGETVTSDIMNTHIRDNLNVLKVPIDDNGYPKTLLAASAGTVGNTGTGETDLHSFTLAADVLDADGGSFFLWTVFSLAANGNTKTVKFYIGSQSFTIHSAATNSARLFIELWITRVSATTTRLFVRKTQSSGVATAGLATVAAHEHVSGDTTLNAVDFESNQVVKFTGQGGATNDIIQIVMPVALLKGPIL